MRFTVLSVFAAAAAVVTAELACPTDERPAAVCCNYLAANQANPDKPTPWSCESPRAEPPAADEFYQSCERPVAACCASSTNYPKGYAGNDCVLLWSHVDPQ
jgi:hypothetical protein